MQYLLDTDICSYVIRARDPGLLATMQDRARLGADISISTVTYAELRSGAERSRSAERYNRAISLFCERLSGVLAWDKGDWSSCFTNYKAGQALEGVRREAVGRCP